MQFAHIESSIEFMIQFEVEIISEKILIILKYFQM